MKQAIYTILITMTAFFVSFAQPNEWKMHGIGGGGALFVPSINPANSSEIFVACDMSQLFHTSNRGKSWDLLPFQEFPAGRLSKVTFTSVSGLLYSIRYNNPTGERFPVKSTDNGQTWSVIANEPTNGDAFYLFCDYNQPGRLIITSYDRIFYSSNGGATFNQIHEDAETGAYIAGVFFDGQNIFIAIKDGLLVSKNNGTTFTFELAQGISAADGIANFSGSKNSISYRFFVTTLTREFIFPGMSSEEFWEFSGIYSLDYGKNPNWVSKLNGISDSENFFFIRSPKNDINTVYIAGGNLETFYPVIKKSTNAGLTWTDIFMGENNINISSGWCGYEGDRDWWYAEYPLGFELDDNNPANLAFTDLGFIHISTNSGSSWTQAYTSQTNPPNQPTPTDKSYSSIGLENVSVWSLAWIDSKSIFASCSDIRAIRSTDEGKSWSFNYSGVLDNSVYHVVRHPQTGVLYAATSSVHDLYQSTYLTDARIDKGKGKILYSTDSGVSWKLLHDFAMPVIYLAFDPANNNTMYASVVNSKNGGIYKTNDLASGASSVWQKLNSPASTEGHPFNIFISPSGELVCSYSGRIGSDGKFTKSSGIFISSDQGASWTKKSSPQMDYWTKDFTISKSNPNHWYACVFSGWGGAPNDLGGLYRSTDAGSSWKRIDDNFRTESCTINPDKPNEMYYTTEYHGLWFSNNIDSENPTFTQVESFPFQHPYRVFFNPFKKGEIWVTSFGGGIWIANDISAPTQFTIKASAGSGGIIEPSGDIKLNSGSSQKFAIKANTGYHILSVRVDEENIGTASEFTFDNVTENHTIHVEFAKDTFQIIATNFGNGNISPWGTLYVTYDSSLTFNITADEGYVIDKIELDDFNIGSMNQYTLENIRSNHRIVAYFSKGTSVEVHPSEDILRTSGNEIQIVTDKQVNTIILWDFQGRKVHQASINSPAGTTITLDFKRLNLYRGPYVLRVQGEQWSFHTLLLYY